jgi:hypothetical protein
MKALQTPQLASASMMLRRKVTFFAALLTFSLQPVKTKTIMFKQLQI